MGSGYGQVLATAEAEPQKIFATNETGTSLSTLPLAWLTEPVTGDGYYNQKIANSIVFAVFGSDADGETINGRVSGVYKIASDLYARLPLFTFTATLGNAVGLSGKDITDSDLFADNISVAGDTTPTVAPLTIDDVATLVTFDPKGAMDVFFEVARGTAASANVLAWTI